MNSWKFYLFLALLFLMIQGVFAMLEMACVSFNKVRLQYYVSLKKRRALWLNYLIQRPALLFGTTLIVVNSCMQLGSECSRHFYEGLGISPDFAPISQIILVLIFAELAPLLAGRQYAEHVVMLGIPLIYFTSIVLRPVIWFFDFICQLINRLIGSSVKEGVYLTREELQYMFEQREEEAQTEPKEITTIAGNIFALKIKKAKDLMIPLHQVHMMPSFFTVGEMRSLLRSKYVPYIPIYQRTPQNIVGIVYPRDLLRILEDQFVKDHARPAWFITEESSILQILKQFRRNNQSIAIVLNESGLAVGILTLDEIIDEIFGRSDHWEAFEDMVPRMRHVILDLSLPGDTKIDDFNKKFSVHLDSQGALTLEELMREGLGHDPELKESLRVDQIELTVEEAPLIGPKIISIHTIF
ncbi:MAG TPA: hemolysin family protein [Rhabdochlamydiaceae bacterium]|nr:hemolysin family protein [Rhabdochlamydiaceae bacterium]